MSYKNILILIVSLNFNNLFLVNSFITGSRISFSTKDSFNKDHISINSRKKFTLQSSTSTEEQKQEGEENLNEKEWELFKKYHALGEWKGKWVFYDYLGDVIDTTFGTVRLFNPSSDEDDVIVHEHGILQESVASDCKTCADWSNLRTIPIGTYTPTTFFQRNRCMSVGMISGPSILRSGIMSTELILTDTKNERIRVVFQHGPVWARDVEPGSGPPQGLKLVRIMVSHEALEGDALMEPIPPFHWSNQWSGTSWTWGSQTSNRLWYIQSLEEIDAWHERPTGDNDNVWSLRILGNHLLIQCPKVITERQMELFRIGWLIQEDKEHDKWKLLRLEAGIWALETMSSDDDDVVSFFPPRIGSLRCDFLQNVKEGEDAEI